MRRTAMSVVVLVGALGLLALLGGLFDADAGTGRVRQSLSIALTPAQGPPETNVTVTGTGFDTCPDYGSGGVVRVLWDGHTMIGETVREPDGTIVEWVGIPAEAAQGEHTIFAQCIDGGELASAPFLVTARPGDGSGGGPGGQTGATTTTTTPPSSGGPGAEVDGRPTSDIVTTTTTTAPALPPSTSSAQASEPGTTTTTTTGVPVPSPTPPGGSSGQPSWTEVVPTPGEVDWSFLAVLTSLALAGALILLVGFPAEVFNKTVERNRDRIAAWFSWLPDWRLTRLRMPGPVRLLGFAVLAAGLTTLIGPSRAFDLATLALVVGLTLAYVVTIVAYAAPGEAYARRVTRVAASMRVVPAALSVAVACAVLSWAAGFVPGYAYGLFMAFVAERPEHRERDGRTVLLSSTVMLAVCVTAWFARTPVAAAAADGGGFGLLVLDAALCGTFVLGVQNIVFGLIPLRFMDGHQLFCWRGPYWTAVYLIGVFGFVHVLLHPKTAPQGMDSIVTVTRALVLFVAFGVASLVFWAYFRRGPELAHEPAE